MKKVYLYPCADSYLLYQYAQNAHDTFVAVEDTDTDWINDAEGYVIGNPKLSKINRKLTVFPTYAPSAKDKAMANYVYSYYRTPVFSFLVDIGRIEAQKPTGVFICLNSFYWYKKEMLAKDVVSYVKSKEQQDSLR